MSRRIRGARDVQGPYEARRCRVLSPVRYPARHSPCELQEVGLHVDDLVLTVPLARKEVLQVVGLEPDGTVDEAVLVGSLSFWPDPVQVDRCSTSLC